MLKANIEAKYGAKSHQCCDRFHFIAPDHLHCPSPSKGLFPIMFRSTTADPAKLKKLKKIMIQAPTLQLRHAMKAASYSDEEIADIAFRHFLQQALPGGSMKGLRAGVDARLPAPPDRSLRRQSRAKLTVIASFERTSPSILQPPIGLDVPHEPALPAPPHLLVALASLPSSSPSLSLFDVAIVLVSVIIKFIVVGIIVSISVSVDVSLSLSLCAVTHHFDTFLVVGCHQRYQCRRRCRHCRHRLHLLRPSERRGIANTTRR